MLPCRIVHSFVRSFKSKIPNFKRRKYSTLVKQIHAKIKATGPLTVADYMKQVLINPAAGYYMHKDMICPEGDFITSPEISQMFGEMVAIWFFSEWEKLGSPKPLQLVEMGPGRGSLIEDILRVFVKFRATESVTIHLVEVSPYLSNIQASRLCTSFEEYQSSAGDCRYYRSGITSSGVPVFWYKSLEDIPDLFSCIVAHEFFDALPIHKFQKTPLGWREVLVDMDPLEEQQLRFVLSSSETVASKLFIKNDEKRDHLEISPESGVIMQHLAKRITEDGGIVLIIDYGHNGTKGDTFRAFKSHKLHNPLIEPGTADLTADVDFSYLQETVNDSVLTYGPVTQRDFLGRMGIDLRLQVLLKSCKPEQQENLIAGYNMMVDEDKMGEKFKVLCMFPSVLKHYLDKYPVAGFHGT